VRAMSFYAGAREITPFSRQFGNFGLCEGLYGSQAVSLVPEHDPTRQAFL
jgi:hypothetical protein